MYGERMYRYDNDDGGIIVAISYTEQVMAAGVVDEYDAWKWICPRVGGCVVYEECSGQSPGYITITGWECGS